MSKMPVTPLLVLVLVLATATGKVAPCDPPSGRTNGCSPSLLPYPFKLFFKPECNKHDACYACGVRYGKSRLNCDDTFLTNLQERCRTEREFSDNKRGRCLNWAERMYNAVRRHGKSHYENPSLSWCDETWVHSCIY